MARVYTDVDTARRDHAAGILTDEALAHVERVFGGGVDPAVATVDPWWRYQRPPVVDPDVGGAIARTIWHQCQPPEAWDGAGGDR